MTERHYQTFIGIDIGKYDCSVQARGHSTQSMVFDNNPSGWRSFFKQYKTVLEESLVIVENTGGYEQSFLELLCKRGIPCHRAHAQLVKDFIRSYGKKAKTDALDAAQLARYGEERVESLELYTPMSEEAKEMFALSQRCRELNHTLVQEKNRLQAPTLHKSLKKSCQKLIRIVKDEIDQLRQRLQELFDRDVDLKERQTIIMGVTGVGPKTSQDLLCIIPELGTLTNKQVASLAGVAPHPNESGTYKGKRFTRGGRRDTKVVLFMAAMSAARSKSSLGEFYQRLVNRGKPKMVALVALMRKMITIMNHLLKLSAKP